MHNDHHILLRRLHSVFGLDDVVLSCVSSYLFSRIQTILISDFQSEPIPLNFGVPQGSVLGPIFFIMYTQPLSNVIDKFGVSHVLYADYTQLYDDSSVSDADSIIDKLQNCILDVNCWMESNKLSLNASKTEAILITSPRNSFTLLQSLSMSHLFSSLSPFPVLVSLSIPLFPYACMFFLSTR